MKVKFNVSKLGKSKKTNEDICGHNNNYAWVIDGATPLFPETIKVSDYVSALSRELSILTTHPCMKSLEEILKQAVSNVRCLYPAHCEEYESPHFAIAFIKADKSAVDYYLLGDCKLMLSNGGTTTYEDVRIKPFAEKNRKVKTKQQYQDTRKLANTPDGYPIGSYSGRGLSNGYTGSIAINKRAEIMLYSDGFDTYEDKNDIFTAKDAKDKVCLFNTSDDCSVMLLET